jgi:hypothetical protein
MLIAAPGQPPRPEPERLKAEQATRTALLRLLRRNTGHPEERGAALVAADELVRRLGSLLVARYITNGSEYLAEAEGAGRARVELAAFGIRLTDIGHYSGDLEYDHVLLKRAWTRHPETQWGQRAFLMLQNLSCGTPKVFGCDGPNCFLSVIEQGESFLSRFPDTALRHEQIWHLAQAYETWWSLALAPPGDITAVGAKVSKSSAERARRRAIQLYEELLRAARRSPHARAAETALPRLKLRLDTAARTFFCFSC